MPFCSPRKGCLPLQGVGKSHEGDGQRSDPGGQREHSFCRWDVLLVKGQILCNLKASTSWFCSCFGYYIAVFKDCTGLAGVLAGGCWEMPKVPVLRWSVCAAKVIWCVIARVTDWPRVLLLLLGSQHCAATLETPCSVPVTNIPLGMITRVPFLHSCWVCADKLTMPPHQTAQEGFRTQGSVLTVRQPDVRHPDLWHQGMCTHRCGTKQVLFLNVSEILYLVLEKKCSTPFFSNLFITWETLWKVQTKLKYNDTTEDLLCMWAFWTVGGSWFWTGGVIVIIGQHFWSTNLQGKFKI